MSEAYAKNMMAEWGVTSGDLQRDTRRRQIENRMRDDIDRMGENYIDLGRCLNAAKDEGLVSHGEWVAWVREHAKMSERNAQRVMRAAREIDADSPLARLDYSKVTALLALPADEREEFAETVGADTMSVRQLQDAIREKKEMENAVERMHEDLLGEEKRRKEAEAHAKEVEEAYYSAREMQDEAEKKVRAETLKVENLRKQLTEARTQSAKAADEENARLRDEISDMEDELERRAKAESEAKEELLRLRAQVARGAASGGERLTPDELATATRAWLGQVAVFPHMRRELSGCDQLTREAYARQIDMVADWCERARAALTVEVIVNE